VQRLLFHPARPKTFHQESRTVFARGLVIYSFGLDHCICTSDCRANPITRWRKQTADGGLLCISRKCQRCENFDGLSICEKCWLNVRQKIKIFVVLILASFSFANLFLAANETDLFNPLDHFVPELVLNPEPQGCSVNFGKWL